ncbi:Caffeic acid 3-O-methyltransferase [Senna tora]|uniref:Caffeic acid 3-O-methyltransferase n=1 Tax=Senna tora TaxID=362788 RepID=A0A835CLU6_9FABA|nr:Caffeic acid 3-O-methyltransferase [Senna tora]
MSQFVEETETARLVVNGKEKNIEPLEKHRDEEEEEEEEDEEKSYSYAMQITLSTVTAFSLRAAAKLGVFDVLDKAGGTRLSAEEIASRLSLENPEAPSMLDRILFLLATHSVLRCSVVGVGGDEDGRNKGGFRRLYGLAPAARFFVRDVNGVSLSPFIELLQHKVSLDIWPYMKDSISEGGYAFEKLSGITLFEYLSKDAAYNAMFNEAMVNQSTMVMAKILETYKGFEGIKKLVDVGGGLGVEHAMGDMFESVPKGDAIFMKWILHNWSDERCVKLLKNCYESLPHDGKVIVADAILPVVPDTSASVKSTSQFDVLMMNSIPTGGKERNKQEFMELATSAGFSGVQFKCFVRNLWIMEFFK